MLNYKLGLILTMPQFSVLSVRNSNHSLMKDTHSSKTKVGNTLKQLTHTTRKWTHGASEHPNKVQGIQQQETHKHPHTHTHTPIISQIYMN